MLQRNYFVSVLLPPIVLFLVSIGTATVILGTGVIRDWEKVDEDLDEIVESISRSVHADFSNSLVVVSLLGRTLSSWRDISIEAFQHLTKPLASNGGFMSCAALEMVKHDQQGAFEQKLSAEYSKPIKIRAPGKNSSSDSKFYLPYTRHSDVDSKLIGIDSCYLSDDMRSSVERLMRSGVAEFTMPFTRAFRSEKAISIVVPQYECPDWKTSPSRCVPPETEEARKEKFDGYSGCGFVLSDLRRQLVSTHLHSYKDYITMAICMNDEILYASEGHLGCKGPHSRTFELGGKTFSQFVTPKDGIILHKLSSNVYLSMSLLTVVVYGAPAWLFFFLKARWESALADIEESRKEENERCKVVADGMKILLQCTSHDMRAPLQACINAASLLKDEMRHATPVAANLMDIIIGSTTFLEALMDNILDSNKKETNRLELVESRTELTPKIKKLLTMMKAASFAMEDVELIANIDEIPIVMCDSGKIQRMVLNLVSNAAKFTKKGTITVNVKLQPSDDPQKVQVFIQVKDTGCGMTEEQVKKLGTPYVHSSVSKGGGSGLGIYICKSYAEMYGGVFNVQSTVGQGTSISFTLTFNRYYRDTSFDSSSGSSLLPQPQIQCYRQESDHSEAAGLLKVLYCEDHPITRKVMSLMLKKMGCNVEVAVDGLEASQKIVEGGPYDVVFMDMQMPHKNGDEVVREFRHWEREHGTTTTHTPIVAMTGSVSADDVTSAKKAGCDHHLSKPARQGSVQKILDAVKRGGVCDLHTSELATCSFPAPTTQHLIDYANTPPTIRAYPSFSYADGIEDVVVSERRLRKQHSHGAKESSSVAET